MQTLRTDTRAWRRLHAPRRMAAFQEPLIDIHAEDKQWRWLSGDACDGKAGRPQRAPPRVAGMHSAHIKIVN